MAEKNAPTKKELADYFTANEERMAAARKADDLTSKLKPMREKIMAHVREHGGDDRTTKRFGFILRIETGNRYPAWKEKFIELAGAPAAEEVRLATPPSEYPTVEKAAAS